MNASDPGRFALFVALLLMLMFAANPVGAHGQNGPAERLAKIGPAPEFTLTAQDGSTLSSSALRGKVVAVNFVFTRCTDVCPIATAKMVAIQREFGERFGSEVFFVSVTVDPDHDTPDVLSRYADALGCDPTGWAFLTGSPASIRKVARSYGVFHDRPEGAEVQHNLLTSLVDREGILRVQYMGERFDPNELLHDLRDLVAEGSTR